MATSAKTPKLAKAAKSATPKPTPRVGLRAKADAETAVAAKPKPLKAKAVGKKTVGAETKTKPAMTKPAAPAKPAILPISDEHRRRYIELAAFYIAERRGFSGGNTLEDWLQAEAEIDRLLRQGKINR